MPEISLKISPMNNPTVTVEGGYLVVRLKDPLPVVAEIESDGKRARLVLAEAGPAGLELKTDPTELYRRASEAIRAEVFEMTRNAAWPPAIGRLVGLCIRGKDDVYRFYAGWVTTANLGIGTGRLRVDVQDPPAGMARRVTVYAESHPDGTTSWQTRDETTRLIPLSTENAAEVIRARAARAAAAGGTS
jgi:hypothetical protein